MTYLTGVREHPWAPTEGSMNSRGRPGKLNERSWAFTKLVS